MLRKEAERMEAWSAAILHEEAESKGLGIKYCHAPQKKKSRGLKCYHAA
jgi:hypothetical protein